MRRNQKSMSFWAVLFAGQLPALDEEVTMLRNEKTRITRTNQSHFQDVLGQYTKTHESTLNDSFLAFHQAATFRHLSLKQLAAAFLCSTALCIPVPANAQAIVSSSGVDLNGDGVNFPANGSRFGAIIGTHDGNIPTGTVADDQDVQYGTAFGAAGQPSSGDAIRYELDQSYQPSEFQLWNDGNWNNGKNDGIRNFRLRFFDHFGNQVGEESFAAVNTAAQQTFTIAGTYNARSFYLIIDSTFTRRPVQWREVKLIGTPITTEPEIDVSSSEGGAVIDGGTDTQGTEPGGTAKVVTYTIENEGTDTLELTGAPTVSALTNITGTPTVSALSATSLAPGETATFTVTYTPTITGPFSFDIAVPNDDADEGPYNIAATGTATGDPEIDISSSEGGAVTDGGTDAQGTEPAGTAKTVTYTIENEGTDTLELTGVPAISALTNITGSPTIGALSATSLAPGESATFDVTYTPTLAGPFSFDITVPNDDADEGPYNITTSGTASCLLYTSPSPRDRG